MTAKIKQIVEVAIKDLKPYGQNARTHSEVQIKQLMDSIKAFGFNNPVLIDAENTIIAGHGRVTAAKKLKLIKVPAVRLEHLTDAQKRAYILADNRIAELAGWDREILAIELQHLIHINDDFDVTITGFSMPEIDLLLLEPDAPVDEDDTNIPAVEEIAVTQVGDIWQLGAHHILCGDALQASSYLKLLGDE